MTPGALIRLRRRALDLTQAALADASGVHVLTIGAIERGKQQPTFATVQRLADALGMSLDALANPEAHEETGAQR